VDFLLTRGREHLAIEVKHQSRFSSDLSNGLRAITDLPGMARRILLYRGQHVLKTEDGIDVLPFDSFSETLAAGTLWP
jgi:hypothetical protein